jgi:hypothetical protein
MRTSSRPSVRNSEPEDTRCHHELASLALQCGHGPVSAPIPAWEPLSEAALADQRGTHDRMRAACPLTESPRGVSLFRHADVTVAAIEPAMWPWLP